MPSRTRPRRACLALPGPASPRHAKPNNANAKLRQGLAPALHSPDGVFAHLNAVFQQARRIGKNLYVTREEADADMAVVCK